MMCEYEYEHAGKTVQVAVDCEGVAHEPRVRWQIGDCTGTHGYVHLDTRKPVLRLEEGETARFQSRSVSEIPIPRDIGEALNNQVEELGTVTDENAILVTDPTSFPSEIDGFQRVGWEDRRNVMWYWRDGRSTPRAYQIVDGKLVFRAQEWADPAASKRAVIDRYELTK
jgi:hypothetical protein